MNRRRINLRIKDCFFARSLFLLFFLSIAVEGYATIKPYSGGVYTVTSAGEREPLVGANLFFVDEPQHGVMSDNEGRFTIERHLEKSGTLVASYIGFTSDSMLITEGWDQPIVFLLYEGVFLEEAVVTARQQGTTFSRLTAQKTELITTTGLMKMACCNLSESFENSATITVGFTDAVSGAKQVQLLGLSGIYTQMMNENIPTLRGLASTYGWSYTPGSWLESIQISKGASSVINGYESIAGQINVEHKKPNNSDPLFINLFYDDANRFEANLVAATKVTDKWSTSLLMHGSSEQKVHDENGDTFMDMPRTKMVNLYNRWFYLDPERGIQSRFGVKFLTEKRQGGQDSICHDAKGATLYETIIENKNLTVYNKTGLTFGEDERRSLGLISSYTRHDQRSSFGLKRFDGVQRSFIGNLLYTAYLGGDAHKYTVGGSFIYDDYQMSYEDQLPFNRTPHTSLNKREIIPGVFAEYTFAPDEKLTFIIGSRVDHNSRYGWLFTPRTNVKYMFSDWMVFRASAGRGFRSSNVIAENIGLMASSRRFDVDAIQGLDIEKAWNVGANMTLYIPIWQGREATLSLDYFRTDFQNQSVVDIERERHHVFFYDLNGRSFANVWQADLSATLFKGFDILAALRYNRSMVSYHDGEQTVLKEKPLSSRYRGLLNLGYATNMRRWVFDATMQFNGPARLPGMNGYDSEYRESPSFPIFFAQVTKNSKRLDLYAGVENLFNYLQKNPIVDPQHPFGEEFDSSLIWGPLMGRKIYVGLRLRVGKLK